MYIRLLVRQTSLNVQRDGDVRTKGAAAKDKKKPLVSKMSKEQQVVSLEQSTLAINNDAYVQIIGAGLFTILILRKFSMLFL